MMVLRAVPYLVPLLFLPLPTLAQQPAAAPVAFSGGPLTMAPGFVRILRVTPSVRTVIIGNPEVLDVSLLDDKTIAVTAKANGVTNVILLDENQAQVLQATVNVRPETQQVQAIYGGALRTFSCAPKCVWDPEPVPPGQYTTVQTTRDAQGNPMSTTTSTVTAPSPISAPPAVAPPSATPAPGAPVR